MNVLRIMTLAAVCRCVTVNAQCADERREISGYPEYATHPNELIDREQQKRLRGIAESIVRSHGTQSPVVSVEVVGHADKALRKPPPERHAFEMEISLKRAKAAEQALMEAILSINPDGPKVAATLIHKSTPVGSSDPRVPNAATEEQMKLNRRVVFIWARCTLAGPLPPAPMPPLPRPPAPNAEDDPNFVFAGNRFKVKMLSGQSAGEVGGATRIHLVIWDVVNQRGQEYEYLATIATVGFPVSVTGEGEWSHEFTTPKHLQVNQFAGDGSHIAGGTGPIGLFRLGLQFNPLLSDFPFEVGVPSGFTRGGGIEIGKGRLVLRGTTKIFKGGEWSNALPRPRQ